MLPKKKGRIWNPPLPVCEIFDALVVGICVLDRSCRVARSYYTLTPLRTRGRASIISDAISEYSPSRSAAISPASE